MRTLDVAMTGVSAALYAIVGYLTNLGIVSPVVGVVRFWPSVIIPAVFSILYGPLAGGIGAAIGIFISDMMIHGNPVLSLLVGVTSNFIGFYILGWIGRKKLTQLQLISGLALGSILAITSYWLYVIELLDFATSMLFVGVCLFSVVLTLIIYFLWPSWRSYGVGSIIGLGIGSAIIGIGVWAFSQFFILPSGDPAHRGFQYLHNIDVLADNPAHVHVLHVRWCLAGWYGRRDKNNDLCLTPQMDKRIASRSLWRRYHYPQKKNTY